MPTKKESGHNHDITLKIVKGVTGVYVAQVGEIPGIIVQAETKEKLVNELKKSLALYFEAFPAEHDKIFHAGESAVEYQRLEVPITLNHESFHLRTIFCS